MLQRVGEDLRLDLLGDAVGMRAARPAALLDERGDSADLGRSPDFVEGVAVVAHDATGLRDVLQFLGKMDHLTRRARSPVVDVLARRALAVGVHGHVR